MRARSFLIGVFTALMLVSVGRGYFAYRSFHAAITRFDEIAAKRERAAIAVDRVQGLAIDLETGVRGFLVTKDRTFLEPYAKAEAEHRIVLDDLVARAPDTEEAHASAERLRKDVADWIEVVGRPLSDAKVFTRSESEIYEHNADGKRRMDAIRVDLDAVRNVIQKLQSEQRAGLAGFEDELVRDQIGLTFSILALMIGVGFLAIRQIEVPLDRLVAFAEGGRVATKELLTLGGVREVRVLGRSLADLHTRLEEDRARELRFTELVSALAEGGSLGRVAQVGLRAVVDDQRCLFGVLWADTPDGLKRVASVGIEPKGDSEPDALVTEAQQTMRLVRVDDLEAQKSHVLHTAGIDVVPSTVLAIPVTIAGRFVGVMELGGTLPNERVAVLDRFLQRIGLALENAAANDKTSELGRRLASANEELASQNEELRVQEEELVAQREELLSKQSTLTLRTEELARASRAKSDFLSTMSHELRTPLNAVIGFSDVLLANGAGELSGVQRRHVADIEGAARQLLGLVNDLLDLAKVEAGQIDLQLADIDVREPVAAAVQLLRPAARAKDIAIASVLPANLEAHADLGRVRQIVVNLISNAVKFTPREGQIEVTATSTGDAVRIEVTDTGPGIRPEDATRVFQPFSQLEAGIAARTGTGLGLSISRQLVEAMGGSIAFEPGPSGGTTFYFTLPKKRGVDRSRTATTTTTIAKPLSVPPRAMASLDQSTEHMLVVMASDDEALVARDLLARAGHHAETAPTFDAAQTALASNRFALVVVDLDARGAVDFVREVRTSRATRGTAIVGLATGDLPPGMHDELSSLRVLVVQKGVMTDRGFVDGIQGLLAKRKRAVVLVVDDNTTNRRVARAMLESASMDVLEADSAESGLAIARRSPPDVVLMDIRMPGMDGLDATRTIRRDPKLENIPVIALSAQAMVGDAEQALEAGCVAYVTKPVSRRELLEAISSALGTNARPRS